jgi:TPR repeat protein
MWSPDDQTICLRCQPWAEEGVALLEAAAGQGHAYAAHVLGDIHQVRKEYEQALQWYTKAAEAGLPKAMFGLGVLLDKGEGMAAADYPAAADWYRKGLADNACDVIFHILAPRLLSYLASYDVTSVSTWP